MMKKDLTHTSAYHGPGFKKRTEKDKSSSGCNSEYKKLKAVLLYVPGKELDLIKKPDSVQHLEKIDWKKLKQEYKSIESVFKKNQINVHTIQADLFQKTPPPNLMYVRDLFWNSPDGATVGRMGSVIRAGEEFYAQSALSLLQIPVTLGIHGEGLFEGADLLWLAPDVLLCGTGNRTNAEAVKQLKKFVHQDIHTVKLPKKVQHLLGLLQIVDKKKALIRKSIAPKKLLSLLKSLNYTLIEIEETDEVVHKQGMNIVTIAPGKIIMPDDCPELKKIYKSHGLTIAAELSIVEMRKGAGGLACATGILSRELIHE